MNNQFTVTSKFTEFLNALQGKNIDPNLVNDINKGTIDFLSGIVVKVGYSCDSGKKASILDRVKLETKADGSYILTTNSSVSLVKEPLSLDIKKDANNELYLCKNDSGKLKLDINIFDIFKNAYLINRPREIWIHKFSDKEVEIFEEAAKYQKTVACIYNREKGFIKYLDIINDIDDKHFFSSDSRPPKY